MMSRRQHNDTAPNDETQDNNDDDAGQFDDNDDAGEFDDDDKRDDLSPTHEPGSASHCTR